MHIDLDNTKQEFIRLRAAKEYKTQEMLDVMLNTWENADLSPDDAGWVLWVLCSLYASGRLNNPISQHKYHSEFFELIKRNFPERAHWATSDAHNGVSLLRGGFPDFWCECYQFANETVPCVEENRAARFVSHMQSADMFRNGGGIELLRSALDAMASLLEEDAGWLGRPYATVIYQIRLFEFYAAIGEMDKANEIAEDIERIIDDWLQRVGGPHEWSEAKWTQVGKPLLGSWQYFLTWIEDMTPAAQFSSVVNIAACHFAINRRSPAAERLFRLWLGNTGRRLNGYTEALFLLSCWLNRHDKDEIKRMWSESQTNCAVGYTVGIAPELAEVLG
jgi:hypothetical protein